MKKFFPLQLIIISICLHFTAAYAQDSVKKTKPHLVNPYSKTKPYKAPGFYRPKYAYKKPGDSAKTTVYAKAPDTSKTVINAPSDKSLSGQYQYLLTKVYNYQQPLLGAFHKSIMDTLAEARHNLKDAEAKLAVQSKTIDSLQTTLKANDATLTASNDKVNAIDMLGITLPKSTYNLIMWVLVILFGVIAAIVIARSGSYSREARYRVQLYNELDEEYKNYKIKANEKEKKLARELQTERNKLDDLLGNNS